MMEVHQSGLFADVPASELKPGQKCNWELQVVRGGRLLWRRKSPRPMTGPEAKAWYEALMRQAGYVEGVTWKAG